MCLGVPGQIVEIVDPELLIAVADVAGVRRKVNITCIVDDAHPVAACIGDWVLIHVGFAMSKIDEYEAEQTIKLLHGMDDAYEDELRALHESQIE